MGCISTNRKSGTIPTDSSVGEPDGSLTTHALGNRTTTVCGSVGQRTALVDANGNRTTFDYRAARTVWVDGRGLRTTNVYDDSGQPTGQSVLIPLEMEWRSLGVR